MRAIKQAITAFATATALFTASQAPAATIVLTDIGGVTGSGAERGFAAAAAFWSRYLTNNVRININVGYGNLGGNILGSTRPALYTTSTANFYFALGFGASSTLDQIAVSNLPALTAAGGLGVTVPGYVDPVAHAGIDATTARFDNDDSANNTEMLATSANLKALGFGLPDDAVDAEILFSSSLPFDFNPVNGITAGRSDFVAVAIHEIGHALGFLSGSDTYDVLGCPNGPLCNGLGDSFNGDDFIFNQVSDLFRYSAPGSLTLRPGDPAYFSIDGGQTQLFGRSGLSTGTYNGDGWQGSHWQANNSCSNFIGIMNPYVCDGRQGVVTAADLAAFDAIGWNSRVDVLANSNFAFTSADAFRLTPGIPEPASWAMMIGGLGFVGASLRVRARRAAAATA